MPQAWESPPTCLKCHSTGTQQRQSLVHHNGPLAAASAANTEAASMFSLAPELGGCQRQCIHRDDQCSQGRPVHGFAEMTFKTGSKLRFIVVHPHQKVYAHAEDAELRKRRGVPCRGFG